MGKKRSPALEALNRWGGMIQRRSLPDKHCRSEEEGVVPQTKGVDKLNHKEEEREGRGRRG